MDFKLSVLLVFLALAVLLQTSEGYYHRRFVIHVPLKIHNQLIHHTIYRITFQPGMKEDRSSPFVSKLQPLRPKVPIMKPVGEILKKPTQGSPRKPANGPLKGYPTGVVKGHSTANDKRPVKGSRVAIMRGYFNKPRGAIMNRQFKGYVQNFKVKGYLRKYEMKPVIEEHEHFHHFHTHQLKPVFVRKVHR